LIEITLALILLVVILPVTVKLPVIVPPVFALRELLALAKAAFAYAFKSLPNTTIELAETV